MGALAPTLFAKKGSEDCWGFMGSVSDGPSYAAATRRSIPFLYSGDASTCTFNGTTISIRLFVAPGRVFPESLTLAAGEAVEVPIRFQLPPGEYEFVAGYGGGVHESRLLATSRFGFDVDENGNARLVGDAIKANLNRRQPR